MPSVKYAIGLIGSGSLALLPNFLGVPGIGDIGIMILKTLQSAPGGNAPQIAGTFHSLTITMMLVGIFGDWIIPIILIIAGVVILLRH